MEKISRKENNEICENNQRSATKLHEEILEEIENLRVEGRRIRLNALQLLFMSVETKQEMGLN